MKGGRFGVDRARWACCIARLMKLLPLSVVVGCSSLLCSCVDPGMYPPDGGDGYPLAHTMGQYPPQQPQQPQQQMPPGQRQDYPMHLAAEYRNGHEIGQRDASLGYPADYRRGFERFGGGYESYFQEGYNDGYTGRPLQH
jgi:hypothetical protein